MAKTSILTILILLLAGAELQAWYNPKVGRWMSRDPVDEPGHVLLREAAGQQNEYASAMFPYSQQVYKMPQGRLFNRESIEQKPLGNEDLYAYWDEEEHNLYVYVLNDPQNSIDPLGEDRYITQFDILNYGGSGGTQIHVGVAVDTWECNQDNGWEKTGQLTFDYSFDYSAGIVELLKAMLPGGKGIVVETKGLNLEAPITHKSCPCEDIEMLRMLREDVKNPPPYSALFHNCVWWSAGAYSHGLGIECSDCCNGCQKP